MQTSAVARGSDRDRDLAANDHASLALPRDNTRVFKDFAVWFPGERTTGATIRMLFSSRWC